MSKGSSINRNKIIKEGVLKQQEGIKNTISKNTDKYNRLQSYLVKIYYSILYMLYNNVT